jgi:hypothetical protein
MLLCRARHIGSLSLLLILGDAGLWVIVLSEPLAIVLRRSQLLYWRALRSRLVLV